MFTRPGSSAMARARTNPDDAFPFPVPRARLRDLLHTPLLPNGSSSLVDYRFGVPKIRNRPVPGGRSGDGPVHDQAASERAGLAVNARLLESL